MLGPCGIGPIDGSQNPVDENKMRNRKDVIDATMYASDGGDGAVSDSH